MRHSVLLPSQKPSHHSLRLSHSAEKIEQCFDRLVVKYCQPERDGADEETIVCALLHDIGDVLSPDNHSQVVAAILQPFISERNFWVLKHHGLFQGFYYFHHINKDRNIREKFKDHQFYQACVDFCFKWDQCSFDPNYDNLPLEHFEPMVRRVMSEPWTRFD